MAFVNLRMADTGSGGSKTGSSSSSSSSKLQQFDKGMGGIISNAANAVVNAYKASNNSNSGSSGGGSSYSAPAAQETYTPDYGQALSDYYNTLKETIERQRQEQERLAQAKYNQLISQANDNYNNSINSITRNNAYTNRWLKQNYGGVSGQGLSNQLRANTNYQNNLYSAQQDLNTAKLNAETDKYNSQAEATNNYISNYNNYLSSPLSSMLSTTAKNAIDDGSYKKYLNQLFSR